MDNNEIKRRLITHIDRNSDFAIQLGKALEAGAWEIVTQLIANAVGFVIKKAGELWEWLKHQFS